MELQHDLEAEELLIVSNRFTRAVERITGKDIFPCIDVVAVPAAKDEGLFTLLIGETVRAHNQGVRGQDYSPELYELEKTSFVNDACKFLNGVYAVAKSQAPVKALCLPSKQYAAPLVMIKYLSDSGRFRNYGAEKKKW